MKHVVLYLFIGLTFFTLSCKKDSYITQIPEHNERKIVAEGNFTDSLKKHRFRFNLSNDIGSTNTEYLNDVMLRIFTPDDIISYSSTGNGWFISDIPFKGIYGESYTIEFTYKEILHQVETVMPSPVTIHEYFFQTIDSNSFTTDPIEIFMDVSSPIEQYLIFDALYADFLDDNFSDTSWRKVALPTYRLIKIPAGEHNIVKFPISKNDYFYAINNRLIEIKTRLITKEVAYYLFELEDYISGKQSDGQFYNPPYYFSNEGYGLGYGTLIDSFSYMYTY